MMPYFFESIEAPCILVLSPLCKVNRVERLKIENKELIYEMAKRLDLVIEFWKEGKYIGKYRFINNKLHKWKDG